MKSDSFREQIMYAVRVDKYKGIFRENLTNVSTNDLPVERKGMKTLSLMLTSHWFKIKGFL